jgi:hypothetical protein
VAAGDERRNMHLNLKRSGTPYSFITILHAHSLMQIQTYCWEGVMAAIQPVETFRDFYGFKTSLPYSQDLTPY